MEEVEVEVEQEPQTAFAFSHEAFDESSCCFCRMALLLLFVSLYLFVEGRMKHGNEL
jgi:hypothetical protein